MLTITMDNHYIHHIFTAFTHFYSLYPGILHTARFTPLSSTSPHPPATRSPSPPRLALRSRFPRTGLGWRCVRDAHLSSSSSSSRFVSRRRRALETRHSPPHEDGAHGQVRRRGLTRHRRKTTDRELEAHGPRRYMRVQCLASPWRFLDFRPVVCPPPLACPSLTYTHRPMATTTSLWFRARLMSVPIHRLVTRLFVSTYLSRPLNDSRDHGLKTPPYEFFHICHYANFSPPLVRMAALDHRRPLSSYLHISILRPRLLAFRQATTTPMP
ncbi:hypothetical protein B0H21DRAFT_129527 [Amylocystis lapponica]|nr:hypothetical protein B0H21DRAFT_129527 [Amylocystis lapponica]